MAEPEPKVDELVFKNRHRNRIAIQFRLWLRAPAPVLIYNMYSICDNFFKKNFHYIQIDNFESF
jgi:hypothetical protein